MKSIGTTLADLKRYKATWQRLMPGPASYRPDGLDDVDASRLKEVPSFGSNPGALRMFTYVPSDLAEGAALVVVLHGCTQTAAGYDRGTGWSSLAERYGFALVLPQQQTSNNPNGCFNWFLPGDTTRGQGEALSIRQMIAKMHADHGVDPGRIFITGLSAGGAMASAMLATYPDVFAGGAIIAGLPYGAAGNVQEAFGAMFQSPARSPAEWGDRVRAASAHDGPWPRISIWHGAADPTVIPQNAAEIAKQWINVHGLSSAPTERLMVDGFPRSVWRDQAGREAIESYTITGMAHGTPLATGEAEGQAGVAGAFLLDVGISSSDHIARFWNIAGTENARAKPVVVAPRKTNGHANGMNAEPRSHRAAHAAGDIGDIIRRALQAAGLMKAK